MSLLLDTPDSQRTTLARLDEVELPEATASWKPVRHSVLIRKAVDIFGAAFDLEPTAMTIGEGRKGAQMFAKIDFGDHRQGGEFGRSVGIRNSYDQSLAVWMAVGVNVFVCSNGCFSGDDAVLFRKHTSGILRDLDGLFETAAASALQTFQDTSNLLDKFKGVRMDKEEGYAHLGVLRGRGVIDPREMTAALGYWDDSPHLAHSEGDLFGLYQSVNHGLKRARPSRAAQGFTALHRYAVDLLKAA